MTTDLSLGQIKQLMNGLNPNRVAQRAGGGGAKLSYLEAWDVRASLIRVFGFAGWSANLAEPVKVLRIDEVPSSRDKTKMNFRVLALATVAVTIHQTGATYTESAAASQVGPDIGEVTDFAVKTAESDAFKRACMNLGTQFGLSLYDNGSVADVVKVILAPGQKELLDEIRGIKPKTAEAIEDTGADPASGEVPAPGEDPRDDLPMFAEPDLSPVKGAFQR